MARLYDRIMHPSCRLGSLGDVPPISCATLRGHMANHMAVVVCDNVAEYWASHQQDDWGSGDFPNLAPPHTSAWYEYRSPKRVYTDGSWKSGGYGSVPMVGVSVDGRSVDRGWEIQCSVFALVGRLLDKPFDVMWLGASLVQLDHMGRIDGPEAHVLAYHEGLDIEVGVYKNLMWSLLTPVYLAISFMHCRNVRKRSVDQPTRLSKGWEKKHGRPLVRYHVLDIDPMKATLESEGGASKNGLKKALHICRGHFATYTQDAPLFGNFVGTVWKPQHVRGNAQHGAVVKDYRVLAP